MSRTQCASSVVAVVAAVISGNIATTPVASAETTLILNNFFPIKSPFFAGLVKPWVADVQKLSAGRIKVTIPAASLGPPPRQWDIVTKGVADVAMTANSFQRKRLKLPDITTIPFLTPSAQSGSVALWRTQNKFFNTANEYQGIKLLAQFTLTSNNIQGGKKSVQRAADLKGMKIRTNPGVQKAIMQSLGATPVVVPGIKAFEVISGGIVDGSFAPTSAAFVLRYGRYLKAVTEFPGGLTSSPFSFLMNQDTWNGLSAADKKVIQQASGEGAARRVGKVMDGADRRSKAGLMKLGVTFHQADAAFVAMARKKLAFVEKGWLAAAKSRGIDGNAALAFYRKTSVAEPGPGK